MRKAIDVIREIVQQEILSNQAPAPAARRSRDSTT
jgi:hypothetical protein